MDKGGRRWAPRETPRPALSTVADFYLSATAVSGVGWGSRSKEAPGSPAVTAVSKFRPTAGGAKAFKSRILIVGDERDTREMLAGWLRARGYEVDIFGCGIRGLEFRD